MNNFIKHGIIVLASIMPISSLAQSFAFEKMLQNKAELRGHEVLYYSEMPITYNGKTFIWNQSVCLAENGTNDTMHIFKNLGYKFYAGGDSAETSDVVKGIQEMGGFYHKFNRSVPQDAGVNEELYYIFNGPKANVITPRVYSKHPALNNNQNNIVGYLNLLGRKVSNETPKAKDGIQMPNGVYINNKQLNVLNK